MIPATLIALALNVPLAELRGFANGGLFGVGRTRRGPKAAFAFEEIRHALIVDDSVNQGTTMRDAKRILEAIEGQCRLTYCAVYGVPDAPAVDVLLEKVPQPRIFEWNIMHHPILGQACVDIDGVLCEEPTDAENDDGEAYLNFLRSARPRFIPTKRIGQLVTSRLEKYRPETEQWLSTTGVQYKRLVMLDLPSAEERRRSGSHARFKGRHYRSTGAELFIESELGQAQEIARISGKPVLSMEGPVLCTPDMSPLSLIQSARPHTVRAVRTLARSLLSPRVYQRFKRAMKRQG
jgi:uncharacterized HAD superfamily protein